MAKHHPGEIFALGGSLTPTEKLVAIALADYGERIHPSQAHIAMKTGLHLDTVSATICSLRGKGIIETYGSGKALTYRLDLRSRTGGTSGFKPEHLRSTTGAPPVLNRRDPIHQRTTKEPPAADAAKGGVVSPWDGIDPEDVRKIRNWCPRHTDTLCEAQRRVTLRKLADLGIRVNDHAKWWRRLGERWGQIGVPPYDQLALELQSIGPDVRDRVSVLAFRLGLGRVAA
jgi:hypothetical protein